MKFTIEFLTNRKSGDDRFKHEIALFDERHQKIASKYGIRIREQHQDDVENLIRWAFIHGSYEQAFGD